MSTNLFAGAEFIASVGKLSELPPEGTFELAFSGRSNVGKSSAINVLVNRKRLAFISKTPGRTQTINFYTLGESARLVDLPGYGYAKVPHTVRAQWDALVGGYLRQRQSLAGMVVIMDARRPFTPHDSRLLEWLAPLRLRLLVLLSKSDKLSRNEAGKALQAAIRNLELRDLEGDVQLFSSLSRAGAEDARAWIEGWLRDCSASAIPQPEEKPPG